MGDKKNIINETRQKFVEVENRILELEMALFEFSNSNLNVITEINNSTHNLLNNSFLLIRYFKILDEALGTTSNDCVLQKERSQSLSLTDFQSIRRISIKSIESIELAISEISDATNLLYQNSNHLKKLI